MVSKPDRWLGHGFYGLREGNRASCKKKDLLAQIITTSPEWCRNQYIWIE